MNVRYGLQARLLGLMVLMLVVVAGLGLALWSRQQGMQAAVESISRATMGEMVETALRDHGRGVTARMAEALGNPLYYFDLDAVGEAAREVLAQPGTRYVLVFDAAGNVLHDGSDAIPTYGRRMTDRFAARAMEARGTTVQFDANTMDVSAPIMVGPERLGGVRIGFDLKGVRERQDVAVAHLHERFSRFGQRQLTWIAMLAVALVAIVALMMLLVQRSLVRPIRRLVESARAIEAGQFETRLPASRRTDEVGDLMRAFARMSESVARHDRDIRHMAYTDALTGLANRHAFRELLDERLLQLRDGGRGLALLFADMDDFKQVNDTLGHDAGDEALLQFAERIRETVQRLGGPDALVARFGGDEFVILMQAGPTPHGDVRDAAVRLANTLIEALARPILVQGREVFLGTSIGVTLFPDDAAGATMLLKNGDIAMYQAKLAGKNCFRFYSRALDQAVERRVHLEQALRGAWERGELSLVYQPVYRLADGALVGAEALLRWMHPEQGSIAPSVFIAVAEQSGLIETLGPQVLHAACADAVRWHRALPDGAEPMFVSVNVSPRQLRSDELPGVVAGCLRETGLPPRLLHVELTETALIADEARAGKLLARLRFMGVKIWLDDFGTGFSGLSHLRRVPVDGVKIDRSFVADVPRDPDDLALTTAIIAMARSLGMTVVAEGIEKTSQYEILRERGCCLGQGYWLGHPVPSAEILRLLGRVRGVAALPAPYVAESPAVPVRDALAG